MRVVLPLAVTLFTLLTSAFPAHAKDGLPEGRVVLNAPGAKVTVEDMERYIVENMPLDPEARASVLTRPGVYREMAENLYVLRTLAAEASSEPGFDEEQARWAAEIAYQRKLLKEYRVSYIREALKDVDWNAAAREEYKANPKRFKREERILASHIIIKAEERSDEEARALIGELLDRLEEGEDFAELAKAYSEDGAARNGGHLGYFQRGKMTATFEEAAFALEKPGDMSGIVETEFGYHIILLRNRQPAGQIPFEEVKPRIVDRLQTQMGDKLWQDKLIALRSSPEIALDKAALGALRKKYTSVPAADR